ncbi:hypothetical protein TO73_1702 [Thermus aquaticus Y51MC23]|uniref:Uncharacterized protein n=1 Tax=Thermus aquaticus (strain ATCC BAA-2747 / Y51MC23) TaxID=498848 RepID=A0ABM5VNG2_THEA5|nr:hypothetical protein TO73_1702 [Thermus aquaticus Y51MC23]
MSLTGPNIPYRGNGCQGRRPPPGGKCARCPLGSTHFSSGLV